MIKHTLNHSILNYIIVIFQLYNKQLRGKEYQNYHYYWQPMLLSNSSLTDYLFTLNSLEVKFIMAF